MALDAVERGTTIPDMKRRVELCELLPHEADALELDDAVNGERSTVGPTAHVFKLALDMFDRNLRADRVVVENDLGVLPFAPGEFALVSGPADLEIASGLEGATAV